MKIADFRNTPQLLEALETQQREFKLDKSKFIADKLPVESRRNYSERAFKDTTIGIIAVTDDLFVLDCDNLYSFKYVADLIARFGVETLTTKSPYGGHFYFKVEAPLGLPHIKPVIRDIIDSNDPLSYYTHSQQLNIEFYDGSYAQGHKIMFDGAANGYYKLVSRVTEPQPLPRELMDVLIELSQAHAKKEANVLFTDIVGQKIFSPNKAKHTYIQKCLLKQAIHPYEFFSEYNNGTRKSSVEQALSARNNFLHSVASWAGTCGYLEEDEWKDFIYLVNSEILADNPLDIAEIDRTILAKGRFSKEYFTPIETLQQLEVQRTCNKLDPNRVIESKFYIAYNLDASKITETYLLVDLRQKDTYDIRFLINKEHIENVCRAYESLSAVYIVEKEDKKGNVKQELDLSLCPRMHIAFEEAYDPSKSLYSTDAEGVITLNLGYFTFNSKIDKILNPTDSEKLKPNEHTLDDIRREFEATSFYKVLSQNLTPDPLIRAKFLGDLGHYLKHKSYLYNALIIKDLQGNTGKDSVLTQYLNMLIFGETAGVLASNLADNQYASKHNLGSRSLSASTFTNEKFNDYLKSFLVVINEDGSNFKASEFNKEYHKIIKQGDLEIRQMHKSTIKVYNRVFTLRYTNSGQDILDKSETNTRFYISAAQNNIDLTNADIFNGLFPPVALGKNPIIERAKAESDAILRYLLLYPIENYCGYSALPSNAGDADSNSDETLAEVLDNLPTANAPVSVIYDTCEEVLDSLIDQRGNLKEAQVKEALESGTGKIYGIALTLSSLYSRKYPEHTIGVDFETADFIPVGINKNPTISSFRKYLLDCLGFDLSLLNKFYRQKLKALIIQRLTNGGTANGTRLVYRGELLASCDIF